MINSLSAENSLGRCYPLDGCSPTAQEWYVSADVYRPGLRNWWTSVPRVVDVRVWRSWVVCTSGFVGFTALTDWWWSPRCTWRIDPTRNRRHFATGEGGRRSPFMQFPQLSKLQINRNRPSINCVVGRRRRRRKEADRVNCLKVNRREMEMNWREDVWFCLKLRICLNPCKLIITNTRQTIFCEYNCLYNYPELDHSSLLTDELLSLSGIWLFRRSTMRSIHQSINHEVINDGQLIYWQWLLVDLPAHLW